MSYEPDRGDVVWMMLNPQSGHEQAGHRPAIVLSPRAYNAKVGLLLCCPITSQEKKYPFEVRIPKGLPISGVILSDQIKSLDWQARGATFICKVSGKTVGEVMEKLNLLLTV